MCIPYCPAVMPPFFATYFQVKEGGGRNNEDLRFASQLSPPPLPRIHILRSTKLCCAVEDENSFDRHAVAVQKDGKVVGHVHVAVFLGSSLAARLLPPAARLQGRMTCRITGLRKPSEISEKAKTSSQTIFYTLDTQILHLQHALHVSRVPQTGSSGPWGGGEGVV